MIAYSARVIGDCPPFRWEVHRKTSGSVTRVAHGEAGSKQEAYAMLNDAANAEEAVRRHKATVETIALFDVPDVPDVPPSAEELRSLEKALAEVDQA